MNKKINISTVIALVAVVVVIGFLFKNNGKSDVTVSMASPTPAVDGHGHEMSPPAAASVPPPLDNLIGKPTPSFALADKDGKVYSSSELRGKNVILFFNEGLMCYPACWSQIVALAKDERLKDPNTVVLSVVVDPPEEWQKAVSKMPELAVATVVFDQGAVATKQFGMLTTTSSMHYGSLPGHTYVLIDKNGIVKHVFDDPNMAIHNGQLVAELGKL